MKAKGFLTGFLAASLLITPVALADGVPGWHVLQDQDDGSLWLQEDQTIHAITPIQVPQAEIDRYTQGDPFLQTGNSVTVSGKASTRSAPFTLNFRDYHVAWSVGPNCQYVHMNLHELGQPNYQYDTIADSTQPGTGGENFAYGVIPDQYYIDSVGTCAWSITFEAL